MKKKKPSKEGHAVLSGNVGTRSSRRKKTIIDNDDVQHQDEDEDEDEGEGEDEDEGEEELDVVVTKTLFPNPKEPGSMQRAIWCCSSGHW
ncbi:hypothetical protein L226DRAFT_576382 [Lentinus tigrinus ALCF2SS1-7]|uniref:Uncharacterized protein n=1 Tax=Lentinus tigrinus ALCF2SS1-6 TaxID=1328759 RepID=A0A5C2RQ83_9APHY|nr:hypothetical protein L227DRAFT_617075 [Lentinus tigrinus ALCF2SS1-6]RPD68501.1 hypothetical protein L226DRAFT_576382 [Lentinus tigrinus ALCF2SS1-7]